MTMSIVVTESGRPDLNRGPPAPKAGAIPGYATPREPSNVSEPPRRINCSVAFFRGSRATAHRPKQRPKGTTAMTHRFLLRTRRLTKRAPQLIGKKERVVTEATGPARLVDDTPRHNP